MIIFALNKHYFLTFDAIGIKVSLVVGRLLM